MKRSSTAVCLVISLCFVSLARAVLGAQEQGAQAPIRTSPNPPSSLTILEKRLQEAEDELASIRKQINTPLTVEARSVLMEHMESVEDELQHIRLDLDSVKAQRLRSSTAETSATSGCCEVRAMTTQRGHTQIESTSCKVIAVNTDARRASSARVPTQACLAGRRIIESQEFKDLDIILANDQGQLIRGQNSFCIEFGRDHDANLADPEEVQAEATMQIDRVKGMRAVVRLTRIDVGRYCAHVDFPLAGSWFITVKHNGPWGKGKAVFVATIN